MSDYITFLDEAIETAEQEQAREDAQVRALTFRQMLVKGMAEIMDKPLGREFVRWILFNNYAFEAQYDENATRAQYREGRRQVAMDVLKLAQEAGVADKLLQSED